MDIRQAKADTPCVRHLVERCSSPLEERESLEIPDGIKPTILYCTNRNVDKENSENLEKLQTQYKAFEAVDSVQVCADVDGGGVDYVHHLLEKNSFFQQCSASKTVHIKVQAQVMLLQNLDVERGLVNGSRGVVRKFVLCPVVRDQGKSGEERLIGPADLDKFPGCTFEQIKFGQRAEFEGRVWRVCRKEKYPLVQFMNGESRIIVPEKFERTLYRQGTCIRKQLPLRLAWALTIHKSQGATLDLVVCDLAGCFCAGQAYVALSRARTMLGLQIKNFSPRLVTTDPLVDRFYEALDEGTMQTFLEEEAGIWWYPLLNPRAASWLRMFKNASSNEASDGSAVFRDWVETYKPLEGYTGWGSEHHGKK
jgi:ATP-dependent DNA helicase PIF1